MCKSIKTSFESKLSFIKLLEAHERASKGKRSYKEVMLFELDLESNLVKDLGLSSFDITELVCRFEDEFDITVPDRKISTFQTIEDILNFIKEQ